jgi:hypothetical protein
MSEAKKIRKEIFSAADSRSMDKMLRLLKTPAAGMRDWLTYGIALRAIGQNLAGLAIESLEITLEGEVFVARGRACRGSSREPFSRRYGPAEIARLDEISAAWKSGAPRTPDAFSLAESLRTVGGIVDDKKGHLVKVLKDERKIVFEYEDENGRQRDVYFSLSVYKGQQAALSMRGRKRKRDVWDDSK